MTRWSLFLQTLSLLHHFLGLYSVIAATLFSYIGFIIRLYNDEVRKQLQFVSLLSAFCMHIVRKVTVLICNYG